MDGACPNNASIVACKLNNLQGEFKFGVRKKRKSTESSVFIVEVVTETCSEQSERNSGTGEYDSPKWSVSRAESELRINMRRATLLHASHGVRKKKKKHEKFVLIFLWCGHRDLNSDGVTIRPSNVRVCLFRHDRLTLPII